MRLSLDNFRIRTWSVENDVFDVRAICALHGRLQHSSLYSFVVQISMRFWSSTNDVHDARDIYFTKTDIV